MNDEQPVDIDQVGSGDISMAARTSSGKKRAGAPAKYVWQYFMRYKDLLGKEVKRNKCYHQVCLGCQTCLNIGNDKDTAEMDLQQMLVCMHDEFDVTIRYLCLA